MKVEFSSRVNTADDDDGLTIQEQASSPLEKHAGSEPRSPLQKPVAGDYASPSAAPNNADLLVWEETVADESSPSRSVPHGDIVVVQESMTVEISTSSSAVVVRDDDDMFLEGRMAVEFASPAVGPDDDDGVAVEDKMAFEPSSPEVVLEDYVMGPEDTIAFEEASPAVVLEDYVMGTEDEMAFESASPAVVPNDDDVAVVEDTMAVEFATSEVVPNEDVVVLQDTGAVEHASGTLVEDTVKFVSSEVVSNEDVVLLQGTGPIELASGAIVLDEDAMFVQERNMEELGAPGVIRDAVVVVQEATAVKPPSVAADPEDGVMVVENTAAVELLCHDVVPNNNAVVLQETGPDEVASRAIVLDEDAMCMQDTNMDELGAPGLIRDDVVVKQDAIAVKLPSPAGDQEDGDVVVVEGTAAIELVSHDVVPNGKAVVLQETGGVELASRATVLDEDVMYVQDTNMDELRAPGVIRDDVVVMQDAIAVKPLSPAADREDGALVVEDTAAIEFVCHDVVQNENAVVVQDRVAVKLASPAFVAHDDVMIQQEQNSSQFVNLGNLPLSSPPGGIGLVASPVVAVEDNLVIQALSSSNAVNRHELSLTPAPVDDSNSGQYNEGIQCRATDGSSSGEHPASISLPEVSEVPVAGERVSNDSEPSLEALEIESPPESLSAPGDSEYPASISLPEVSEVPVAGERVSNDSEPSLKALEMESPPESLRAPGDCQHPACISLPEVSEVQVAGERLSNASEALEMASSRESPSAPKDSKLFSMNGSAGVSTFPAPKEAEPSSEALEMASHQNPSDPGDGRLFSLHGSEGVSTLPTQKEAELSLEALETASPLESLNAPGDSKLLSMNGLEGASTFLAPEEADQVENDTFDEQQPAKKAKISGTTYSGTDAVAVVLGQTAEIVLVLAGMSQMRAGRVPTSYERELAASAYQNLGLLVCQLAPNNLVAKESVERMLQDYNEKIVAQKKREDQAWVEALNEAEALANVRAEALARAKAEAAARAQAEMAAKAQAEAAARAQAETEERERRQQAAMKVAAPAAANGPSKGGYSAVGGSSLSSGQSAYKGPELTQSPSLPTQAGHHNSQVEIASQILSPMAKGSEIPRSVTQTEKSISVNGRPHAADSKPTLGRPPKVRNRVRKEPATLTIFTPEFLNEVQSQGPDPEKAHVTHKQLCAGVQQFIRDHVPPVSQNLQALPPTYISTPFPCQVCKLIANDTGSVLVCDSCDEVSHVKCVQPPSSRGAAKGDWNCPKCLISSRGGKCPSKYGPIRHGSPNSVKLWPPHDTSEGNPESNCSISNGSVREVSSATAGRQIGLGPLKVQRRTGLEIDTLAHQSVDDPSTGNFGSSPHLIVHLVNEPSPKTSNPLNSSSQSLVQDGNQRSLPSGQSVSSLVQETSTSKVLTKDVAAKDKSELIEQSPTTAPVTVPVTGPVIVPATVPVQIDSLKPVHTDEKSEGGLERSLTQSVAVPEDTVHEVKNRRATPAHIKKTETRTQTTQSKKGNVEPGVILPGKKADVPLPIVMEWVGESTRRAEGKVYYRACSVGGITFSVSDCALFRPETPDVPPYIARLQVLWEDIATGHKWVRVSWCYYPTDIPLAMGRPGTTLPDEVYESNHCDNNLVGSIQGPCFVLPPLKFMEETDRRRTLKKRGEAVDELSPIFLSRWMYDAPKGVFRPLQE